MLGSAEEDGEASSGSCTEEDDLSPHLQLLKGRRPSNMSKPSEDTGLVERDKLSGKAWGRVKNVLCCGNKYSYPSAVFFILGNEFCERFSFYGMKAILVIYLTQWLGFHDDNATGIFHTFSMLCYFMPLFGGILADSYLGKYKTILYLSILYCVGNALMALTALPPPEWYGPVLALLLISIGTGGIKPCVSAFGGDQFSADQEKEISHFFSVFYFIINVGSLLSMLITPLLRSEIHCFGGDCYPVAFGIPAVLMLISLVIFVAGRKLYKVYPPTGNVVSKMCSSIGHALVVKRNSKADRDHWLDHADDKFETRFLEDVKAALRVLLLFLPLPVFWALFDQQGRLGHLKPDQMQALNPIGIIVFIPLFENVLYPLFGRCKLLTKPLQRMGVGMLLATAAFVIAGFLQIKIEATMEAPLNTHQSSLHYINASPCPIHINDDHAHLNLNLAVAHGTDDLHVRAGTTTANISPSPDCTAFSNIVPFEYTVKVKKHYHILLSGTDKLDAMMFEYSIDKPKHGGADVSIFYAAELGSSNNTVTLLEDDKKYTFNVTEFHSTPQQEISPGTYKVYVPTSDGAVELANVLTVRSGGVYTVVIQPNVTDPTSLQLVDYEDAAPNKVSILYQIPQYVVITSGEILFSISGLHFAYSQAPTSMKAVLQAAWLMTVAGGNLIVVIVAEGQFIPSQAVEFFVFAALMAVDLVIFSLMAWRYRYVRHESGYDPVDMDRTGLVPDAATSETEAASAQPTQNGRQESDM